MVQQWTLCKFGFAVLQGRWLVQLEITLFVCRENATVSTPECEQEVLRYVLEQLVLWEGIQQQWQEAGELREPRQCC